jgi:hypothetical protein
MKANRDEHKWANDILSGTNGVDRKPLITRKKSRFTFGNVVGAMLLTIAGCLLVINLADYLK